MGWRRRRVDSRRGLWKGRERSEAHGHHRGQARTRQLLAPMVVCLWNRPFCLLPVQILHSLCCAGRGRSPGEKMWRVSSLLAGCVLLLAVTEAERFFQPGRRVCSAAVESRTVSFLASRSHPVYQPYLTVCQGQRLCSTYSTTYRVSQHRVYRTVSQLVPRCCPGWRRASGHARLGCNTAVCQPPCQNRGKCSFPNKCACPAGWTGRCCQTDVDECAGGRHGCSQTCLNVAGSYRCGCRPGHQLQDDGKTCQAPAEAATDGPGTTRSPAGSSSLTVQEDVKELRSRVLLLEEKLQVALDPFLSLDPLETVHRSPLSLLLHLWQQVDRIDSLSEQISFLEERLETCTCQPELGGQRSRKSSPRF